MPQSDKEKMSIYAPGPLLHVAEMAATELGTSHDDVVAGWICAGAENTVIDLLQAGRISKGYAVEALNTTYFGLDAMLEARQIRLGMTDGQMRESRETGKILGIHKRGTGT